MRVVRKKSIAFITILLLFSCRQTDLLQDKADQIAGLECRAIQLREQRFALADKMRFTQDTLLKRGNQKDSFFLSRKLLIYSQEKEILLRNSLSLADTIHKQLDSLRKFVFKSPDDKKEFDRKLNAAIIARGCQK